MDQEQLWLPDYPRRTSGSSHSTRPARLGRRGRCGHPPSCFHRRQDCDRSRVETRRHAPVCWHGSRAERTWRSCGPQQQHTQAPRQQRRPRNWRHGENSGQVSAIPEGKREGWRGKWWRGGKGPRRWNTTSLFGIKRYLTSPTVISTSSSMLVADCGGLVDDIEVCWGLLLLHWRVPNTYAKICEHQGAI